MIWMKDKKVEEHIHIFSVNEFSCLHKIYSLAYVRNLIKDCNLSCDLHQPVIPHDFHERQNNFSMQKWSKNLQ